MRGKRGGGGEAGVGGGPRRVGASLDHVARLLGLPTSTVLETVFADWDHLVGPALASHARPVSLTGGVLVVSVDDPAWGSELRYLSTDVLSVIAARVGDAAPRRMDVRVLPAVPEETAPRW